ncbi:hypothetical protein DUI87_12577 [Hirundo rustica rustica]|uniref:DUF4795 domain-containing protein n=1 Tax=Hirundo rustica rustica TaxID=333673 RepID=A0A3M0KCU8_HIRRU|nr:hypothetical protein DUI87_12577 [Hirundo rustica rustica]
MATSLDSLSLSQLLDVSIGMPRYGAVHFAAMRKLLQAVLEHLDVQYLSSEEPWPGHLSGPSLADVAAEVKEIKKEIEINKKHMSEVEAVPSPVGTPPPDSPSLLPQTAVLGTALTAQILDEAIGGIKAELSHLSEDISKMQKAQTRMAEDMKKFQEVQDEDTNLIQDLIEEIDRLKTAQNRMEGDIKKTKEALPLMKKMGEDLKKLREDTANWKEEISKEMSQQIEAVLQETKSELQKMEEQQEMRNTMLEQLVTETANKLNEQLGEVPEPSGSQEEEQEKESGDCSSCTFNIRLCLGDLLQRCEKLQEQVESLESRHMAMGKLKRIMRNWGQDQERLHHVEATVVQIQGNCEKLSFASGRLQKDSQQKQKAIEMLFQSLEKLQKEKADEQDMLAAMDLKADRAALGSKVNCSQFEANMERMDERMQELQSQISDQEQHWNTVQQQFSDAMEEKLGRQELKAFSDHMEETWNRNLEELENRLSRERAAGIKKQLPVPFTCLSCDRMLTMHVPGHRVKLEMAQGWALTILCPIPQETVHGSVSRVSQSSGDHQSSMSTLQHINASLQRTGQPPVFLTIPSKLRLTQLLDSIGHISRGHDDQHPVVIGTQCESGVGLSWHGMSEGRRSWLSAGYGVGFE